MENMMESLKKGNTMAKVCLERNKLSRIELFELTGKFIYSNGDIYEGAFSGGCKCGKGKGLIVCDIKFKEI